MLKKRLLPTVRIRSKGRRNDEVSSGGAACDQQQGQQQQQSARGTAPAARSRNMFCSSPNCDGDGAPLPPPPKYEEFFGSGGREEIDGSDGPCCSATDRVPSKINPPVQASSTWRNSSSSGDQNANQKASGIGVEHVTIFKIRSDAPPEKVEAFLAATRFLAYRIDGVLSLSIGKIFVDTTFMEDKSNGLAEGGGYAMTVRLRDMEAYRSWVQSEARKEVVIEHAIPLMPATSVHTVVAFQSEETVGEERLR